MLCYSAHVDALALQRGIVLCALPTGVSWLASCSQPAFKTIWIRPVVGTITYACALHEMGHLETWRDSGMSLDHMAYTILEAKERGVVTEEIFALEQMAWGWARKVAWKWTPQMTRVERFALGTYEKKLGGRALLLRGATSPEPANPKSLLGQWVKRFGGVVGPVTTARSDQEVRR